MPWTKSDYPASMKNLPKAVRDKAVEIANALLEEKNKDEGIAIATGISKAKDWAVNHGKKISSKSKDSRTTDVKQHGEDRYVTPTKEDGWAVKKEGTSKAEKVFDTKQQAVQVATKKAKKANASVTVQKKTGQVEKRISFNPNNKGKKT